MTATKTRPRAVAMLFLIAALALVLFLMTTGGNNAKAATITVDDSGGANYEKIQDAIDVAEDGDTIRVYEGNYAENVVVDKSLTIIGNGTENTTIDARGNKDVVRIQTDYVNISKFNITGSGDDVLDAGIEIYTSNNIISRCNISNNDYCGIRLYDSSNNTISSCNILFNYYDGIWIHDSTKYNTISDSNISNNRVDGIRIYWDTNNNTISNNIVSNNNCGIKITHSSDNNNIYHNNFIDNTNNAYDECSNNWDNDKEGNYWDDYKGEDNDGNGIGDTPHDIPGGENKDRYPLMKPFRKPITVDDSGGADYERIQDAINAAENGDTIRVYEGTYSENVVVNKTVSLVGNGSANTTINGGSEGDVVRIEADWVNLSGFRITGSGYEEGSAGVRVKSDYNFINANNCSGNDGNGISLEYGSHNNMVTNNTCSSNRFFGISLEYADSNVLFNNTCSDNEEGIRLFHSGSNTLSNNTCVNNKKGIYFDESDHSTLSNNTCSENKEGIYFDESDHSTLSNNTCLDNDYAIRLYGSDHIILSNNTYSDNQDGIYLRGSYNTITNNTCVNNFGDGIYLRGSYSTITNNTCVDNFGSGITFKGSYSTIYNNTCSDNQEGIRLSSNSNNNTVYNNTCSDNGDGIVLQSSPRNTVVNNVCNNNSRGIDLPESNDNTLMNNTCSDNTYGIYLSGSDNTITGNLMTKNSISISGNLEDWNTHTIDTTNTVNGKPVRYYKNVSDMIIPTGAGQVILANCTNIMIEDQNLSNGTIGVCIGYSSNITILNNTCSNNKGRGISLFKSDNNTLLSNTCFNNSEGVTIFESNDNVLSNNTCSNNNSYGIRIYISNQNTLTNNTCSGNEGYGINIGRYSDNNTITNNTISDNDIGIRVWLYSRENAIHYNLIYSNSDQGINATDNDGYMVNATKNYWGHGSGPYHAVNNTGGKGDNVTDYVDFGPWYATSTTTPEREFVQVIYNPVRAFSDTIQGGVDAARKGDTVLIAAGAYEENVVIDKTLTIIGDGSANSIIDGDGNGDVVTIAADFVNLSGFLITNGGSGGSGMVSGNDYGNFQDLEVTGNRYGIYLLNGLENTIRECELTGNSKVGIHLVNSDHNLITGNTLKQNEDGVALSVSSFNNILWNVAQQNTDDGIDIDAGSGFNQIANNTASNNAFGIVCTGAENNTIENNTADDNTYLGIALYIGSHNNTVRDNEARDNNGYGIALYSAHENLIIGNEIDENGITFPITYGGGIYVNLSHYTTISYNTCSNSGTHGIDISESRDVIIWNNICSYNNGDGILIESDSSASVEDNICSHNGDSGIRLSHSGNNIITDNLITNNRVGIRLEGSSDDNTAHSNDISENTRCGIDASDNDGETIDATGNWWGHASGPYHATNNSDGKGDSITDYVEFGFWIKSPPFEDYDPPEAFIDSVSPSDALEGEEIEFTGHGAAYESVERYAWTSSIDGELFNDTSSDFSTTLSNGTHTISFKVQDNYGVWSEENSTSLTINGIPRAKILSVSPSPATPEDRVVLSGQGTDDSAIERYAWREGGVDIYNGTENEFELTDLSLGIHIIHFKVQDDKGVWSQELSETLLVHRKPSAFIDSISPNPVLNTKKIEFKGHGDDDGSIQLYVWRSSITGELHNGAEADFGTTLLPGSHTITFAVVDDHGVWSDEATAPLTVHIRPTAAIASILPPSTTVKKEIQFTGNGADDGNIVRYAWRSSLDGGFYNGTELIFKNSTLSAGTHTIYLKVQDNYGIWSKEVSTNLVIRARPTADIAPLPSTAASEGKDVHFAASPAPGVNIARYVWTSSIDGELYNGTEEAFKTSALSPGEHIITLRVEDEHGVWSQGFETMLTVEKEEYKESSSVPVVLGAICVLLVVLVLTTRYWYPPPQKKK